jgi:sulfur carrier protein
MSDVEPDTLAVAVIINGSPTSLVTATLAGAMVHAGVPVETAHVAIAVNDAVVPRAAWATVALVDGDRIEIITAVAGG